MRTTITINDTLFKSLKMHAAGTGQTISALVEDAVKEQLLEDAYDLDTIQKRLDEPRLSFDELVKQFKSEGLL
jgi:predicted transcriptional regulator